MILRIFPEAMSRAAILPLAMTGLLLGGCAEKKTDTLAPEARALFRDSEAHIRAYTDSMKSVRDSASWSALDRRFEDRLAKLNFKYPPNTDLHLSQGENDTLYALTNRYVEARTEAHIRILKGPAPADTVPSDTVAAPADTVPRPTPKP